MWKPSYQPELYHHGVKGQKWGVRRFQPYPDGSYGSFGKKLQRAVAGSQKGTARAYNRSLRKIDFIRGESSSRSIDSKIRHDKLVDKAKLARFEGKDKKADRLEKAAWKTRAKYEISQANLKAATKAYGEIGQRAVNQGYAVSMKEGRRFSQNGQWFISMGAYVGGVPGAIGGAAYAGVRDYQQRQQYGGSDSAYAYRSVTTKVGSSNKKGRGWTTVSEFDPERRNRR